MTASQTPAESLDRLRRETRLLVRNHAARGLRLLSDCALRCGIWAQWQAGELDEEDRR